MTTREWALGETVIWLDIRPDGFEYQRSGQVWSAAPALAGRGRAWWVIPRQTWLDGPSALYVVLTGRRHRCGRSRAGKWLPRAGRWLDPGEAYRETHPGALANEQHIRALTAERAERARTASTVGAHEMALFEMLADASEQDSVPAMSVHERARLAARGERARARAEYNARVLAERARSDARHERARGVH
jgi:hypothetical protein